MKYITQKAPSKTGFYIHSTIMMAKILNNQMIFVYFFNFVSFPLLVTETREKNLSYESLIRSLSLV